MKKSLFALIGMALAGAGAAQTTWNTNGNIVGASDYIGTRNGMPLLFYTNSVPQMTLQKTGGLTLNSLAGSGNRILFADPGGNLKTLTPGDATQVLLGTGDWGILPTPQWMQSGSNLSYTSGFVGIGNSNPQSALDVTGKVSVSDQLSVSNNLLVGPSAGQATFNYSPGDAASPAVFKLQPSGVVYHGGLGGNTSPDPQPNLACLNGNVSVVNAFANVLSVATNTTSTSATGGNILLGHNGTKAFIETQGTGTGGANHPGDLFINENCGRNVHVFNANTGTPFANNSTNVMSVEGSFNVARIMQLGELSATNFVHTNCQLSINANTNSYGIRVRHFQVGGAGIKVVELDTSMVALGVSDGYGAGNNDGPDRFTVKGNGQTIISATAPESFSINNANTGASVFKFIRNGNDNRMWVMNPVFSYNFGIDNAGTGHIGANINSPSAINLINFRPDGSGNSQVWIGNMKQAAGSHTDFRLAVDGKLVARSCYITVSNWADYVFANDYKVPSLYDVEAYYKANKHLPEIPSEAEVKENGIDVAEMNKLLLKKVEEMTILMVQQQKDIDALKAKLK